MRVRLRDVANRAGVSVKTVTNVVNGYVHVAPDTRARVQGALDEMGYRPNLSARSLRTGRTGVIALALPELDKPYFAELAGFVVKAAEDARLDRAGRPDRRAAGAGAARRVRDPAPAHRRADPQPRRARRRGPRAPGTRRHPARPARREDLRRGRWTTWRSTTWRRRARRPSTCCRRAARASRRSAASPAPPRASRTCAAAAAEDALLAAGLPDRRRAGSRRSPTSGASTAPRPWRALLDRTEPPDAVFCFNDLLALGALRHAAPSAACGCPRRWRSIGLDDIEDGRFSVPTPEHRRARQGVHRPHGGADARGAAGRRWERARPARRTRRLRAGRPGSTVRVRASRRAGPGIAPSRRSLPGNHAESAQFARQTAPTRVAAVAHPPGAHVEELRREPFATHRHQADLRLVEAVGPRPAADPGVAVLAGVRRVAVLAGPAVHHDPQRRGVAGRTDDAVAVDAASPPGAPGDLLGELGLPGLEDRHVHELEEAVGTAVEHEARLDEVVAAPLGRQVEPHPGLHDVVTATRSAAGSGSRRSWSPGRCHRPGSRTRSLPSSTP